MDKKVAKLLARLTSLKNNIPEHSVTSKYVDELHSILQGLETSTEEELSEFYIPAGEVKPRLTSHSPSTGSTYSRERYCDREFLLMKIDGVLAYFTLQMSPEEVRDELGFKVEEN